MYWNSKLATQMQWAECTQVALARACSVPQPTVSQWLRGNRKPTRVQLRRIVKHFGVDGPEDVGYVLEDVPTVRHLTQELMS